MDLCGVQGIVVRVKNHGNIIALIVLLSDMLLHLASQPVRVKQGGIDCLLADNGGSPRDEGNGATCRFLPLLILYGYRNAVLIQHRDHRRHRSQIHSRYYHTLLVFHVLLPVLLLFFLLHLRNGHFLDAEHLSAPFVAAT